MIQLLIFLAYLGLVLFVWHRFEKRSKAKHIERAFARRARLDEEAFYEEYFRAQGVPPHIVSGVRRILEENLEADLSRLSDEDDFSKNLKFFWNYDSMAGCAVLAALEKEFNIDISDDDAQNMRTVRDIVEAVRRKVTERAARLRGPISPQLQ